MFINDPYDSYYMKQSIFLDSLTNDICLIPVAEAHIHSEAFSLLIQLCQNVLQEEKRFHCSSFSPLLTSMIMS